METNDQQRDEEASDQSFYTNSFQSNFNNTNNIKCDTSNVVRKGVSKAEGPLYIGVNSVLLGLQQTVGITNQSHSTSVFSTGFRDVNTQVSTLEFTTIDMSLSTLYLHELHHRYVS